MINRLIRFIADAAADKASSTPALELLGSETVGGWSVIHGGDLVAEGGNQSSRADASREHGSSSRALGDAT
jgi:hypothetical protein